MSKGVSSVPKPPTGSFPPILRLLDNYFSSLDPLPQKQRCLDTLHLYLQNIYMSPLVPKYRFIKSRNVRFSKDVMSCQGGELVMLQLGFNRIAKEFEEWWELPDSVDISTDYFRIKKYKELMDLAILNDKNAPQNKLKEEKTARENAVKLIEEDARARKLKNQRGKIAAGRVGGLEHSEQIDRDNRMAMIRAREAALQRHPPPVPALSSSSDGQHEAMVSAEEVEQGEMYAETRRLGDGRDATIEEDPEAINVLD